MPKPQKPDDKLPKKVADKARDAALANMLRTPPKPHKEKLKDSLRPKRKR